MADEFLPPVVTKLSGEIADLLGKLAEAKAAIDAFNEDVKKKSESASKETGGRSAQSLLDEFKKRLESGTFGDSGWYDRSQIRQDISKAFEKAGADGSLSLLRQFQKALGPEGMQTAVGQQVIEAFNEFGLKGGMQSADAFGKGFTGVLKTVFSNPVTAVIGGAIVASVVTELGAMIQGALLAGIGGAGLAAGVVGQMEDPQIKSAVTDLGAFMKSEFQDASSPLHDDILRSISDLQRQSGPIFDTLKKNFQDLEPYLRPLIDSIGVFFKAAAPGWSDAVKASGPALLEVARAAQMTGNAFGIFFEQISHNKGAVEGLDMLFRLFGGTLVATGYLLHGLEAGFNGLVQAMDWVYHNIDTKIPVISQILSGLGVGHYIDGIAHSYDGVGLAAESAIKGARNVTLALDAQKKAVDALVQSYNDWFGKSMTVEQATLAVHTGMMDLTDSIKQNGQTFDENTRAGSANYNMLLTEIGNLQAQFKAETDAGMSTKQATQLFQSQYDQLIKNASQNGLTADQIARINAEFGQLLNNLNSLDGKTVHYSVYGSGAPINPSTFWQGVAHGALIRDGLVHAAQGFLPPRDPGTLVLAGEPQTGGEVMIPQRGISQQRAAALGMAALSPYGLGVGVPGGGGTAVIENHTHVYLGGQEIAHTVDMIYPGMMAKAGQRRKGFGNSGLAAPFNPAYPTGNTFGST